MSRSSHQRCSMKKLFLNWKKWGKDIIMFHIYSFHFGIFTFVFYPETIVRRCSLKICSQKFLKIHKKTPVPRRSFKRR